MKKHIHRKIKKAFSVFTIMFFLLSFFSPLAVNINQAEAHGHSISIDVCRISDNITITISKKSDLVDYFKGGVLSIYSAILSGSHPDMHDDYYWGKCKITCYMDADHDGYGDPANSKQKKECKGDYVSDNTDCDDSDGSINPGATEIYGDDVDQDCDNNDLFCGDNIIQFDYEECDNGIANGVQDPIWSFSEGGQFRRYCSDSCVYVEVPSRWCGDSSLQSKYEECDDGNNTDGDGCNAACEKECTDNDGDLYYEEDDNTNCIADDSYNFGDCNDSNDSINPDATEICGNITDEDCDGYAQACAAPKAITVKASKIICDSEDLLPNWGDRKDDNDNGVIIDFDTATNFVSSHSGCHFADSWDFQWGQSINTEHNGTFVGPIDASDWSSFDSSSMGNDPAEVVLPSKSGKYWFREVLKENYIPFTYPQISSDDNESAEFYCYNDVYHYDNMEGVSLPAGGTYYCVAFNVLKDPAHCGDGYVNQDWEECDGSAGLDEGEACTDMCTIESDQCSDETFARITVSDFSNTGVGDISDRIYLGSDSYYVPSGAWFPIGDSFTDDDMYEDVPGLAVQRVDGSVRVVMHTSLSSDDLEVITANLEFYNADVTIISSDNSGNNKLESSDSVEIQPDGSVDFYLIANTADDGFYTDWNINEDCSGSGSSSVCGNGVLEDNEECDDGNSIDGDLCGSDCMIEYCGDNIVNQEWEECDGTDDCDDNCQFSDDNSCSDLVLAKINTTVEHFDDSSDNMTTDIYLGLDWYHIPTGTWFPLYFAGAYIIDSAMDTSPEYEDVPGLAVERSRDENGLSEVRALLYGSHLGDDKGDKEHVHGNIEFYNSSVTNQRSDNSNDLPGSNVLENDLSGPYEVGDLEYEANNDEVWFVSGDMSHSYFWLTTTVADDGYYSGWEINNKCVCGDGNLDVDEECDDGNIDDTDNCSNDCMVNQVCEIGFVDLLNPSFETPEIDNDKGWDVYVSSDVFWNVDWVYGGTTDATPKLEIQSYANSNWNAPTGGGDNYAELDTDGRSDSNASVKISQDVETVVGAEYELSFEFAARPGTPEDDNILNVYIDGDLVEDYSADGSDDISIDWENKTITFVAQNDLTNIAFEDGATIDYSNKRGVFLDDVKLELLDCIAAYCGDGELNKGEECDDGNQDDTDLCSNDCMIQTCDYSIEGRKINGITYDGIGDWEIHLYNSEDEMIATTSTNGKGYYNFSDLCVGDYAIKEVMQDGWMQVYPGEDDSYIHNVILSVVAENRVNTTSESLTIYEGNNFVNKPMICGHKYDSGHDGIGVDEWQMDLFENSYSVCAATYEGGDSCASAIRWIASTTTSDGGKYCFETDNAGLFTVTEGSRDNWSPDGNTSIPVDFDGISPVFSVDFYNHEDTSVTHHSSHRSRTVEQPAVVKGIFGEVNLHIEITADKSPVTPGDEVGYTIVVTNNGWITAEDTVVNNTLPEGLTFKDDGTGSRQFDLGNLGHGGIWSTKYKAIVGSDVADKFVNMVKATASNKTSYVEDSVDVDIEIPVVKGIEYTLPETGFNLNEFLVLLFALFISTASVMYLRKTS